MEYLIAGIVFGLCLFLLPLWSYRKGLQDGLNIKSGELKPLIKNPVVAVKEYKEKKQEEQQVDHMLEGLQNIMSYTGGEIRE